MMQHEPVTLPPDPTSTERYNDSGILIDDLRNPPIGVPPVIPNCLPDQYFDYPVYIGKIDDIGETTTKLFSIDPISTFRLDQEQGTMLPWQVFNVLSHSLYDFIPEVTILAVKHPMARGKIKLSWNPGQLTAGETHLKVQRWLWDLEKDDQFSVTVKGPKNYAMRSLNSTAAIPTPTGVKWKNYTKDFTLRENFQSGILDAELLSFIPSSVGPDTFSILVFIKLTQVKLAEFRGIQSVSTQPMYGIH